MKKVISVLLSALMLLGLALPALAAESNILSVYSSYKIPSGSMRMTAHRGYSALAPENTLPAFRLAGEYGFWGAECDTSPSADGVWVIMHDDTVDRTTDGTGFVQDLTFAELRSLSIDAGSNVEQYPGTKIPTLVEYLDVCKEYGVHPVIEIKPCSPLESLPSLAALLSAREEKDLFTIITFGREHAARIKALLPETPVFLLVSLETTEEAIDFCYQNRIDGLDFICWTDETLIRRFLSSGLKTMCWTVDDIETAERLYRLGVRDLTTNSLTQTRPQGNIFQQLLWLLRDFFGPVAALFYRVTSRVC